MVGARAALVISGVADLHVHGAPSLVPRHGLDHEVLGAHGTVGVDFAVLKAHEGSTAERAVLDKLLGSEEVLAAKLGASRPTPADASGLAEGFSGLVDSAQSMLTASTQLTQRAIERLQDTATRAREKWLWLALATAGVVLITTGRQA